MNDAVTPEAPSADAAAAAAAQQPQMRILTQYIRDLSFENVLAQKGAQGEVKPEVKVQVSMDAKKRPVENQFEVLVKLEVTSADGDTTLFVVEMEYAGIVMVDNVQQEQLHPFLMIEGPRQLFPFIRRIVSDVTRDGGFPQLNLEQIDFRGIYMREMARRLEEQKAAATQN